PEGYQTTIGEKGFGLSGGQKQRISIARALLKNASILVFDDVTSALDLDTEHKVFKNIADECGNKTLLLVTHRATALKDCDEILFLDRGEIIERGNFAELMAQNGNFAEIYNRQINEVTYEE
ncbi:MAG: ATP-binding cassette domain-containing protein, partial [Clostridia bacterium]|nr:ATP-binding cassette domain-containing protein [Clostridia bacterium]